MAVESVYLAGLQEASNYKILGVALYVSNDDESVMLVFEANTR